MKAERITLSIIIPTFNAKKFVTACIESVLKSNTKNFEIIIVDNGSTDRTLTHLKTKFPSRRNIVKLLPLGKNYGPARARNEGVKVARGEYIAFLDSDTIVDQNWANEALDCFKSDKKIAAVQCKLLFLKNKKKIDYVGEYLGNSGFLVPLAPHGEKDKGQYDSDRQILAAKSAGMFITKEAFEKIGGFDEDYFIFVEETDLGWRCWLAGYQIILCSNSIVYHHFSATKEIVDRSFNNHLVRFHGTKNYILTLYKNLSSGYLIRILPVHLLLWSGLSFYLILTGNYRSGLNIFKGILWNVANLPINTKKRSEIQKTRIISDKIIFEKLALMKNVAITVLIKKFINAQHSSVTPENQ